MKVKILSFILLVMVTTVISYSMYMSKNGSILSNIMLANVEALASNNEGDFEIVCNQSKHTPPGNCWMRRGECFQWTLRWDDCTFIGDPRYKFTSPCP